MMKSLAPVAFTGITTIILWKILKILMAPVIAWFLGILALGLMVAVACVAIYGPRRVMWTRANSEEEV